MKRYAPFFWVFVLSALAIGVGLAAREIRDRSYPRRIYFVEGEDLWYILAREYRDHTVIGETLLIETDHGVIDLDATERCNQRALEKIKNLKAQGILPKETQ